MSQRIAWTPRSDERVVACFLAQARETESSQFDVEMVDISEGGCCFKTSTPLEPGTHIWIAFHGLSALEAIVAWNSEGATGCRFQDRLHPAVFTHLLDRARKG